MTESDPSRSSAKRVAGLSLVALGVVYGDIGTSPLYALRECFFGEHAIVPSPANVFGVLSLIFWSLIIVISIKYLVFVMRADNRGEGGILALMALVRPDRAHGRQAQRRRWILVALGLFGAALLYGDGMITPAISVLSAVEGLEVATPVFRPYVIPVTIVILIGLFLVQHRGTAKVGAVFGPIMLLWFVTIGALGVMSILRQPRVIGAVNPYYALDFFVRNRATGFLVLGSVFLVVTGGEALYADMGHFGPRPIRLAWFTIVLPGLLLNYFGQGALLITNPQAAHQPFYRMAPAGLLYPMVIISTIATVIASQAIISGAFSLTQQAVQLGYLPRVEIDFTSPDERGQIYVPQVNWALMLATIGLVIGFQSSSNLASAYGVAVTTTMVITTVLLAIVEHELWGWRLATTMLLTTSFIIVDLAFFGANLLKIAHGGWFPLVVAALLYTVMSTWEHGRRLLRDRQRRINMPFDEFAAGIRAHPPVRVPGTAVFMTGSPDGVPMALQHNLRHNKVLHERVLLLTVLTEDIPRVPRDERVEVQPLEAGFYRVTAHYGFMQDPNAVEVLTRAKAKGLDVDMSDITFFLGRETLLPSAKPEMARWRYRLFAFMSRNARHATNFFRIPTERVVELGMQIDL
ncbi:MAG TPA: potassium transporter Kup [Vicinamibacterales bacterium]|nr:potassium transporter Kup [Vicinamibacterales bacterium]